MQEKNTNSKSILFIAKEKTELMHFLMKEISGISRTKLKKMLSNGLITVDNKVVSQYNFQVQPNMTIKIDNTKERRKFSNKWIRIIYEDRYLVVVEKREGILSNSPTPGEETIQSVLNNYFEFSKQRCRAHTVHRLDKNTSGLMIFAKDKQVSLLFEEDWKTTVNERRYIAIVEGYMEKDYDIVESWLKDNKMFVTYSCHTNNGGKLATTHYKTLKRKNEYSLVDLKLDTGRKNQIRVHMQDLNHPIVGDFKYGSTKDPIGRLALHAYKLCFQHPITKYPLEFETQIPPVFLKLLQ